MQLYTVRFATKHVVRKFDQAGQPVGEYIDLIPQTVHALPEATARSYSKFENFQMEPYRLERDERGGKKASGAQTYRKRDVHESAPRRSGKSSAASKTRKAAATGDMSAAISGGS